jgi:hypothetical protein
MYGRKGITQMTTQSQIDANRRNAEKSTGPRTEKGRATSSRNHFRNGLFSQTDFVLPEEADTYREFCSNMDEACNLVDDAIEECLAHEITSAAWRLRRCNLVDGDIAAQCDADPFLDPTLEKQIRSVERARAHSTSIFHRNLNQLRKIQKDRTKTEPKPRSNEDQFADELDRQLQSIMNDPGPAHWDEFERQYLADQAAKQAASQTSRPGLIPTQGPSERTANDQLASNCKTVDVPAEELASNCKTAPTPARTRPCPCKSGRKYKHCCGKNIPSQSGGAS